MRIVIREPGADVRELMRELIERGLERGRGAEARADVVRNDHHLRDVPLAERGENGRVLRLPPPARIVHERRGRHTRARGRGREGRDGVLDVVQ